ncbi:hypothetical protein V5O48_001815 [Marasmius crinis-equi]|uniref:Uncharacterized protein n=1 Tax=Marasmius crinis-equi TaxID=585013 RepID=A0ABR3FXF5_9AGAR
MLSASSPSGQPQPQPATKDASEFDASVFDLSKVYIAVEKPKEYQHVKKEFHELDAFTNHDDQTLVYTTQPSITIDPATGEEDDNWYPDWGVECLVSGYMKRHILQTPGFPQPVPRREHNLSVWTVRTKWAPERRDQGHVAEAEIETGQLIFAERPVMVVPVSMRSKIGVPSSGFTQDQIRRAVLYEREQEIRVCFNRLTDYWKESYIGLHNRRGHRPDGTGMLTSILETHGLILEGMEDPAPGDLGKYRGVFESISKLNHRQVGIV